MWDLRQVEIYTALNHFQCCLGSKCLIKILKKGIKSDPVLNKWFGECPYNEKTFHPSIQSQGLSLFHTRMISPILNSFYVSSDLEVVE